MASHTRSACPCCLGLQVVQEAEPPLSTYYRHISKGAWPFSSRDHGWPISDCTSEGFKAALGIAALGRTSVLSGPQVCGVRCSEACSLMLRLGRPWAWGVSAVWSLQAVSLVHHNLDC